MIGVEQRPRLRRGVRLSFDRVRQAHVLLFPEGVVMPNATAVAVLELCDGERTVAEIVTALSGTYSGVRVEDVQNVLARFVERHVVEVLGG
ncbi:pyrroloquinoline quinone biosynthesis peptide chaperone PqqD [Allokutzneria sp. A3M-2-11 16]|uniref:pyrroloquinoline quinone biosynthesis peptide chaperone PqqD n=1 Tax=Allokutzneria sp. A3M-2-11 16 TaxID=2962043 RepID=UPI0020B7CF11|nr:pyrroloquinoline quinone biosynthesis peptide chaperone PqqD [Allokutzneria sp. A3M-2-11 16]MCP3798715.1 pyrroloquinoline quinone biosynthesis peptide chaperone PqqD [Allokutzneria sp. A3M-2-11 16]